MENNKVKQIVFTSLGMALVFLATFIIKIPNGIQGYFNLGDGFIMVFASIVNPFMAFMIGGVGSGLADVIGGYGIYFLPTLLIKGLEAVLIASICKKMKGNIKYVSFIFGGLLMVAGYFICDSVINESWSLGITGIPANLFQASVGVVIAYIALPLIKKNTKNI